MVRTAAISLIRLWAICRTGPMCLTDVICLRSDGIRDFMHVLIYMMLMLVMAHCPSHCFQLIKFVGRSGSLQGNITSGEGRKERETTHPNVIGHIGPLTNVGSLVAGHNGTLCPLGYNLSIHVGNTWMMVSRNWLVAAASAGCCWRKCLYREHSVVVTRGLRSR